MEDTDSVPELCYETSVNCEYNASINDRTSAVAAGNDCWIDLRHRGDSESSRSSV